MLDRVFEQWISAFFIWSELSFGTVTLWLLIFWAGAIVQDLYNPDSWIRLRWRKIRQLYDIESVGTACKTSPEKEWLALTIRLRVVRNIPKGRLTMRVESQINPRQTETFVLHTEEMSGIERAQEMKHTIAVIPLKRSDGKPLGYQSWGGHYWESGDIEGMKSLFDGSENICKIEMRSGWRKQIESVFIAVLHKDSYEHGRVFITTRQLV